MKTLYVDYNEIRDDVVCSLLEKSPEVAVGERVQTSDHEGENCEGVVEKVDASIRLIYTRLDWETWGQRESD